MLNTLPVVPTVRQPRAAIKLNGTAVPFLSWETDTNSFYQADTFRCSLPLSAMPDEVGPDVIGSAAKIEVEIFAGFPADASSFTADDLTSIFFGRVDDITVNLSGRTLELTGRDLTGALIDEKSSEKYTNQTASQIASALAAKHGLTPVVTDTETKAGKLYQIDHVRLQDERTDWDLLTWLAKEQDFVCFVRGKELHFEPRPDEAKDPYVLQWTPAPDDGGSPIFNGTRISLARSLTLAKDISVTVKSWSGKSKKAVLGKVTRTNKGSKGEVQKYSYTIPGLTADEAQQRAQKILAELTRHEMRISVDGPADNLLGKSDVLKLTGTGSAWDQIYFPSSISRTFSTSDGYAWRIDAKNHAVESEPTL